MQALQTLVRNLAVILLLATILEMLLPNKSMKGYVQLVMGLFVISAILNPLMSLFHMPMEMDIPAWTSVVAEDLPVLAADNSGEKLGRDAVQEQYRQILVNQIKALVLGVSGIKQVEVELKFQENSGGFTDQPRISQVTVRFSQIVGSVKPVEPVVIGQSTSPVVTELSPKAKEVQERVITLMELTKEQVIVQEG
ncbi:MAG: stage III sporulation protein AF [Desulfitobacteriaceae bacterium]